MKKIIERFKKQDLGIDLFGEIESLEIIDWEELEEKHQQLRKKTDGMTREALSDFWSYNESSVMQITEYFMNDDSEKKVKNKEWVPFGVLGLGSWGGTYAEMGNLGLLLFDLTNGDQEDPPIIYSFEDQCRVLANRFSELKITSVE